MAQKTLFSRLGNNPKQQMTNVAIILIIIVVVGIVLYFFVIPKFKAWFAKLKQGQAVDNEIAQGGTLSYDDAKFATLAESLYRAMKGFATDVNAVYAVFRQMNTKADILKLIQAFGVRDGEDLQTWLSGEILLSIPYINSQILQPKGIDFVF